MIKIILVLLLVVYYPFGGACVTAEKQDSANPSIQSPVSSQVTVDAAVAALKAKNRNYYRTIKVILLAGLVAALLLMGLRNRKTGARPDLLGFYSPEPSGWRHAP